MKRIRIFVVDDHPLFRTGLRAVLENDAEMEIVGEANTGEEAIAQIPESLANIILMDIKLPGIDGIEHSPRAPAAADYRSPGTIADKHNPVRDNPGSGLPDGRRSSRHHGHNSDLIKAVLADFLQVLHEARHHVPQGNIFFQHRSYPSR